MDSILFSLKHLGRIFKYISFKKIFNLIHLRYSYQINQLARSKNRFYQPHYISIELSNYCNLKCPECPVGTRENSHLTKNNFELELLTKIIDELKSNLFHAILYFQGEPFLNPNWFKIVRYINTAKIYTSTSTNGQMLNKQIAEKIILSGLDKLIVSIDGNTQDVYEQYRVGGNLAKVIEGIENVNYFKKKFNSVSPFIEIQFLVLKTNEHQLNDMRILAKKLNANKLSFKTAQLYDYKNGNPRMTTISKYSRYKKTKVGTYVLKHKQPNKCWRMWSGAVVNVNGEILPCCFDKESEYSFGNVRNSTFTDCWNSKIAFDFRESILTNRKQFEMCRNCTSN